MMARYLADRFWRLHARTGQVNPNSDLRWSETHCSALQACIRRALMQKAGKGPWVDPLFQQKVLHTAYFLWEEDGKPNGQEQQYWFGALERRLRVREADVMLQRPPLALPGGQF
ncbi:DUF2934 domain-containing protein [Devosia litorisediminis]